MVRLQLLLDRTEAEALSRWAAAELRDPRDQIRLVLRQELERRGLLQSTEDVADGQDVSSQADREGTDGA